MTTPRIPGTLFLPDLLEIFKNNLDAPIINGEARIQCGGADFDHELASKMLHAWGLELISVDVVHIGSSADFVYVVRK